MRDFLRLPHMIYRDDPNWVPPLLSEVRRVLNTQRNPFFSTATLRLFVAYRDGLPAARTALVINRRHEEKFGVRTAFFGFFETTNDEKVVHCLFAEVERYCLTEGVEVLEGPFNPNHYSELGLQTSGFGSPPSFFQTYNPEYYPELLEEIGFAASARMFTAKNEHIREYVQKRYGTSGFLSQSGGFRVRSLELDHLDQDLERIREVFNDAFASNWHFISTSEEEYTFSTKFLKLVTDPDLVKIVERGGEPVAVLMCVLDIDPLLRKLNGRVGPVKYLRFLRERKRIHRLIIYAVGIKKAYQRSRAFELLLNAMCEMALRYEEVETTWIMPHNILAIRAAERLGLAPDKHFVIYEKRLTR
jgi:hypothetical protein